MSKKFLNLTASVDGFGCGPEFIFVGIHDSVPTWDDVAFGMGKISGT
jgi:hypothetical protein